ncbi:uncharacterized protein SCHCODRAFT_02630278 [Schizophyllum commune H4-8]|uniref:uncharacterized protein n=1 Tax=Schizophyllum commune (strain H4-8 / FGSC 9210) TaxID=578458 RepID=UPI00215F46DE|nr:uncharacterized protein SCHCODRAFT_02630278 [Schizophyllum commune H4-8]KAI5889854.1 hypothetical protein SCHCODRAFT_02630278 [Schizophyllum commune H4-8]
MLHRDSHLGLSSLYPPTYLPTYLSGRDVRASLLTGPLFPTLRSSLRIPNPINPSTQTNFAPLHAPHAFRHASHTFRPAPHTFRRALQPSHTLTLHPHPHLRTSRTTPLRVYHCLHPPPHVAFVYD